jgi:hypothetical protein
MASSLYYTALNRKLTAQLGQALGGTFATKRQPVSGTVVTIVRAAIGPQIYPLTNADTAHTGDRLTLVNIGRPSVALYAPEGGGAGSTSSGSGGGLGGSLSAHELAGADHLGFLAPQQAPWAVMNDGTRTLVGPSVFIGAASRLAEAITEASTTIYLYANTWQSGDVVRIVGRALQEWLRLTSNATGDGPFAYTVTRDIASTGALAWLAGDAVALYGHTGANWLDINSGTDAFLKAGPTIAATTRTGAVWNDTATVWALGNLRDRYGFAEDRIGAYFGQRAPGQVWGGFDADNGFRIMDYLTRAFQVEPSGRAVFGRADAGEIELDPTSGAILLKWCGTTQVGIDGEGHTLYGVTTIGRPLGPALELAPIDDPGGDEALQRFGLWVREKGGARFFTAVSGTEADPTAAYWRAGYEDSDYIQLRDRLLTWHTTNTTLDAGGLLTTTGAVISTSTLIDPVIALASGKIFVGSAANLMAAVALSGDATLVAAGTLTIAAGAVTLAKMANMATASLIYRKTVGTGAPEVNTLATLKTDLNLDTGYLLATGATVGASAQAQTFTNGVIGPTIYGGTAANDDLMLEGTSDATKTTSYVILQPSAGNVGIGIVPATYRFQVFGDPDAGKTGDALFDNVYSQVYINTSTSRPLRVVGPFGSAYITMESSASGSSYHGLRMYAGSTLEWSAAVAGGDFYFWDHVGALPYVLVLKKTTGRVGIGVDLPATLLHTKLTDTGTNAIVNVLTLDHATSGTAAAGFGLGINLTLQSSTTAAQNAARLAALWNVATHASRSADLIAYASDASGERELWRGRATGTAAQVTVSGDLTMAGAGRFMAVFYGDEVVSLNNDMVFIQ